MQCLEIGNFRQEMSLLSRLCSSPANSLRFLKLEDASWNSNRENDCLLSLPACLFAGSAQALRHINLGACILCWQSLEAFDLETLYVLLFLHLHEPKFIYFLWHMSISTDEVDPNLLDMDEYYGQSCDALLHCLSTMPRLKHLSLKDCIPISPPTAYAVTMIPLPRLQSLNLAAPHAEVCAWVFNRLRLPSHTRITLDYGPDQLPGDFPFLIPGIAQHLSAHAEPVRRLTFGIPHSRSSYQDVVVSSNFPPLAIHFWNNGIADDKFFIPVMGGSGFLTIHDTQRRAFHPFYSGIWCRELLQHIWVDFPLASLESLCLAGGNFVLITTTGASSLDGAQVSVSFMRLGPRPSFR